MIGVAFECATNFAAGFSPLIPNVNCAKDASICQLVAGETEINAASETISALVCSPIFDLTKTYFLIAGVNPKVATVVQLDQ